MTHSRFIVLTLVLFLCWIPTAGFANSDPADQAKKVFDEGRALFNSGAYARAAQAFSRANELNPNWRLWFNIGQSNAAAKNHGIALEAFSKYLSLGGDDVARERRLKILEEIRTLREMTGSLTVTASPGCTVRVAGIDRGTTPLVGKIAIPAGVTLKAQVGCDGNDVVTRSIRVLPRETTEIKVENKTIPGAPADTAVQPVLTDTSGKAGTADQSVSGDASEEPVPDEAALGTESPTSVQPGPEDQGPSKSKRLVTGGWIVAGVGAAALVGGGVTGGLALSEDNVVKEKCIDGQCYDDQHETLDRRNALALSTDILLGVGAAAVVTGVILIIVGSEQKETNRNVSFIPNISDTAAGFTAQWRF